MEHSGQEDFKGASQILSYIIQSWQTWSGGLLEMTNYINDRQALAGRQVQEWGWRPANTTREITETPQKEQVFQHSATTQGKSMIGTLLAVLPLHVHNLWGAFTWTEYHVKQMKGLGPVLLWVAQ